MRSPCRPGGVIACVAFQSSRLASGQGIRLSASALDAARSLAAISRWVVASSLGELAWSRSSRSWLRVTALACSETDLGTSLAGVDH
jgi:hypothetical protein